MSKTIAGGVAFVAASAIIIGCGGDSQTGDTTGTGTGPGTGTGTASGVGGAGTGTGSGTGGAATGAGGMGMGGMGMGGMGMGGMGMGGTGAGGMGQGGMGQGGACTFVGYSNACNMCLDNLCTAEESACCSTTGCQGLVECVAANCANPQDLACIVNMCSMELQAAGGTNGQGTLAAQSLGICAGNNCPSCN